MKSRVQQWISQSKGSVSENWKILCRNRDWEISERLGSGKQYIDSEWDGWTARRIKSFCEDVFWGKILRKALYKKPLQEFHTGLLYLVHCLLPSFGDLWATSYREVRFRTPQKPPPPPPPPRSPPWPQEAYLRSAAPPPHPLDPCRWPHKVEACRTSSIFPRPGTYTP